MEKSRYDQAKYIVETSENQPLDMRLQLTLLDALRSWVMRKFNREEAAMAMIGAFAGYLNVRLDQIGFELEQPEWYRRHPEDLSDRGPEQRIWQWVHHVLNEIQDGKFNLKEAELSIREVAMFEIDAVIKKVKHEQELDRDRPVPGTGGDGPRNGGPSGPA